VPQAGQDAKVELEGLDFPGPGLSAWTIDVHFDPDVLELHSPPPLFAVGVARVGGAAAVGRLGDFTIASITFTCLTQGVSDLGLEVIVLRDGTLGDPQPIDDAELTDGEVFCGIVPTVTPTPTRTPTPGPSPTPTNTAGPGTPTEEPPTGTPDEFVYGDADCNREANSVDAALILQAEAGLLAAVFCPDEADVNGDGEVDSRDAALLLQFVARLLPSLPP
jgi:hypothetical protein